jgi:hypothetical protein
MHLTVFPGLALVFAASVTVAQPTVPASPSCADRARQSTIDGPSALVSVTGATVGVIDSASLAPFMHRTLSEALTARIPGVSVMHSSGVAGAGSRVRLRGPSGIILAQEPLLYIDGIRVEGALQSITLNAGGQAPSRLDDVPLEEVDCIYVLRGPAATARFGTDAAGGVIHVVTRRAGRDQARVHTFLEGGTTTDITDYPANFGSPNGGTCSRARAALGQCVGGAMQSWSPTDADSPFRTASLLHGGGRVTVVNGPRVSLGVSGSGTVADGALRKNDHQRYSAVSTATVRPGSALNVEGDLWLTGGKTRLPQVGNFSLSILNSALLGSSIDDPVRRGYRAAPLSAIEQFGTDQRVQRIGGVARVRWTPRDWLAVSALAGREDARVRDEQLDSFESSLPDVGPTSVHATAEQRGQRSSANVSAAATYGLASARLTTEVGLEYLDETDRRVERVVIGRGQQAFESSYAYSQSDPTTTGLIVRQALAARDRVFLEGGVRYDVLDRAFVELKNPIYPFASVAWNVVRPAPASSPAALSSLRVRAAFGESGDSRPYDAAIAFAIAVPPGTASPSSRPQIERAREIEGGIDVGLFGDRANVVATYFAKRTSDALVPGVVPPSIGTGTGGLYVVGNSASWENRGIEVGARARVVDAANVRADIALTFTSLKNEVLGLGSAAAPIVGTNYRITPGYPLYGTWGRPFSVTDQNGDGVIVPSEVTAASTAQFLGASTPTRELGIAPTVVFGRALTISALIDYRGGFRAVNSGGRLRCNNARCAELYSPDASLADQARAVDAAEAEAAWIEDASFVKLRELAMSWTMPAAWSRAVGARASSVTLAGRNLATSTSYTGLDPEGTYTGQTSILQEDLFVLPLPRTVSLRLDVRW